MVRRLYYKRYGPIESTVTDPSWVLARLCNAMKQRHLARPCLGLLARLHPHARGDFLLHDLVTGRVPSISVGDEQDDGSFACVGVRPGYFITAIHVSLALSPYAPGLALDAALDRVEALAEEYSEDGLMLLKLMRNARGSTDDEVSGYIAALPEPPL